MTRVFFPKPFNTPWTLDNLFSTDGRDIVFGTRFKDVISTKGGNDLVFARGGDDMIDVGSGNDTVFAGRGDDVVAIGAGHDKVFGGRGLDAVVVEGSYEDYTLKSFGRNGAVTKLWKLDEDGKKVETNKLFSVEEIRFDDYTLFLDGRKNAVFARDDMAATDEDTALTIDAATLLANDENPNGDAISILSVDGTSAGGASVSLVGSQVVYDPAGQFDALAEGETATDTFDYTVDDGKGGTSTATVTITLTGRNDAPVLVAPAAVTIDENTTVITTVSATDVDSPTVTFSISGGADAALFQIDGTSGALSFINAPDFEAPTDAGLDNVYDVQVAADDLQGGTTTQDIAVTVSDVLEVPVIDARINEIHYDNAGTDTGEFIELRANTGNDLSLVTVLLYNGSNGMLYNMLNIEDATMTSDGTFDYYVFNLPSNGLQNGSPDGIALKNGPDLVEFLSYEGSFAATNGPIEGESSTDIGVAETSSTAIGFSLQRLEGDVWDTARAETKGADNAVPPAPAAQLVINEIMQNPSAVSDSSGEYFEIYNAGSEDVDINGYTISDNGSDNHVINNGGPLIIPAGGFLVLGNNADMATNGGVPVDYSYGGGFFLANGDDELVIADTLGREIDRVEWDGGPEFPDPTGASMELIDPTRDNNVGANWETAEDTFGDGDFGTPGAPNAPEPFKFVESFEEEPGATYTLTGAFDDGGFDYFGRFAAPDNSNGARDDFQSGFDGNFAIHAQDIDGDGGPATGVITIPNIDIGTLSDPVMSVALGALAAEPDFNNYEAADGDGVKIYATVDGGARTLIGEFAPNATGASDLYLDTNGDGVGDGDNLLTSLVEYQFDLPATGSLATIEIEVTSTGSFEPIALDKVCVEERPDDVPDDGGMQRISAIQGTGSASPMQGMTVTVSAVVIGDFQNGDGDTTRDLRGFWLQEELTDEDGNPLTSEGLFVFDDTLGVDVNVGDLVEVTGTVTEFFGETQISAINVSVVTPDAVADVNTMAKSVSIDAIDTVLVDDNGDYVPDLEAYEGMLVTITDTLTINEMFQMDRFNQITLSANGRPEQFTQFNDPDAAAFDAYMQQIESDMIIYDDGLNAQNAPILAEADLNGDGAFNSADGFNMGDTVDNLTGVLNWGWAGNSGSPATWRMRSVEDNANTFIDTQTREETPPDVGGDIVVSSFNVLNFFTTLDVSGNPGSGPNSLSPRGADNQDEYDRQLDKLVTTLSAMDADIYGLVEIENEFGTDQNGDGLVAINELVSALNGVYGAGTWAAVDPGVPFVETGDAISVGMIYNTTTIALDPTSVEILTDADLPALGGDYGTGPVFDGASTNRAPMAATFTDLASGEDFTVAVTHMKSKGGSGTGSDADAGDGAGNFNETRTEGVAALVDWLATFADEDQLVLGDFNAYKEEDPIDVMLAEGYANLEETFDPGSTSFVFDGQTGTLDYAFANGDLLSEVTDAAVWQINSLEPDAIDYNTDFGRDPLIFDGSTPDRSSDHDPILIGLEFAPVVPSDTPLV